MSSLFSETWITQKYIKRYGRTRRVRAWERMIVHIRTENGVWRIDGHGYTLPGEPDAWILPFKEAMKQISHCGPEKQGCFILVKGQNPVVV